MNQSNVNTCTHTHTHKKLIRKWAFWIIRKSCYICSTVWRTTSLIIIQKFATKYATKHNTENPIEFTILFLDHVCFSCYFLVLYRLHMFLSENDLWKKILFNYFHNECTILTEISPMYSLEKWSIWIIIKHHICMIQITFGRVIIKIDTCIEYTQFISFVHCLVCIIHYLMDIQSINSVHR